MKNKVIETFNSLSSAYEHAVDRENLYNSEYERPAMLEKVAKNLSGMKVLDAGCAAGWYTLQLSDRGAKVVAIDISPEMVSSTRRRVGNKAEVFRMDLEADLPFEDDSFDFIVSSLTLHYIEDWTQTFSEFKRILKPAGFLLFSIHHPFTDARLMKEADYFSTELVIERWKKNDKFYDVPSYRRPLNEIFTHTLNHFSIEEVIEPKPTLQFKERDPQRYERLMAHPKFLIIKAVL